MTESNSSSAPLKDERVRHPVGIDLGTTNSCVGFMNETQTDVILADSPNGPCTTPSCVWYDEASNNVVIGSEAFLQRGTVPGPVISVKRKMGKLMPIPLGKAGRIPNNLPSGVKRALCESREERLQRYLARLEAANPEELEAVRQKKRLDPPRPWVLDQTARLKLYLSGIADPELRARVEKDPPLLWLPEEISAVILAEEKRQIESRLHLLDARTSYVADRCLITVPAYFGSEQNEATKEAGILAGLEVLELLQEPTAAALYYCWKFGIENGVFLVFDLGGGTFDVSIVKKQGDWSRVIGISGDNLLGGDDIDRELAEWIRQRIAASDPRIDLALDLKRPQDRSIWERLVYLAEEVKKQLSDQASCRLNDTSLTDLRGRRVAIQMEITRDQLERLITPLVQKTIPKCWEAIARAQHKSDLSLKDVDQIFLVGGATHMPLVQRIVRERFCQGSSGVRPDGDEIRSIEETIRPVTLPEMVVSDSRVLRGEVMMMLAS